MDILTAEGNSSRRLPNPVSIPYIFFRFIAALLRCYHLLLHHSSVLLAPVARRIITTFARPERENGTLISVHLRFLRPTGR